MAKASKKSHPEDAELAAQIAKAHRFSACLHRGPNDRITRYVEQGGAAGYAEALAIKAELDTLCQRRAIVYAINALGSFPVTAEQAVLAGLVA